MCSAENIDRLLADEYEIQHFDFSSTDLIVQYRLTIINTIKSIHEDMEKCIVSKLSLSIEEEQILHSEIVNLQQRYTEILSESIKKFEQDIRNFFAIPKDVILESDKIHSDKTNKEDLSNLQSEIDALEKEYLKEKMLIALYKQEFEMFAKIEPYQQHLKILCKNIDKFPDILKETMVIDNLSKSYNSIKDQLQEALVISESKLVKGCCEEGFVKKSEMEPLL